MKNKKIKFNKEKFLEIRNNSGLKSSAELLKHIGEFLKHNKKLKSEEINNRLCDVKTLQRMEDEGKATNKTLELVCEALEINKTILLDDNKNNPESIAEQINFNPKIDNVEVTRIEVGDIKKFTTGANKRIYFEHYDQETLEKSADKVQRIIELIDQYSKLTNSFSIISSQNFNESENNHLKKRANLRRDIEKLFNETNLFLYAAKVKYYTFWPFPNHDYINYLKDISKTPFLNDIYYPKPKTVEIGTAAFPESYEFDPNEEDNIFNVTPIKLSYTIFVLSRALDVGSISYNSEACFKIANDIARAKGGEIPFEDEEETILGKEIKGSYQQVLQAIETDDRYPENYLDPSNIKLIYKSYNYQEPKKFNIKDYDKNVLNLADEILNDQKFFGVLDGYWDQNNKKNVRDVLKKDSKENTNHTTRLEYLETSGLKKTFFDGIEAILKHGHWIRLDNVYGEKNLKKSIFESGIRPLVEHIDFKIEEAQMDAAYEDGYFDDVEPEMSKHEADAAMDYPVEDEDETF